MFRRLFWLSFGATVGFGAALWVMVRVRRTASRFTPEGAASELAQAVRQLGADLRAAAIEGREGMRDAEHRLRAELAEVPSR